MQKLSQAGCLPLCSEPKEEPYDDASRHQVFDNDSFRQQFYLDIQSAQEEIFIQTPSLSVKGIERIAPAVKQAISKGVRVCFYVQEPRLWLTSSEKPTADETQADLASFQAALVLLRELQAHVNFCKRIHERAAVIDGMIVWEGTINLFGKIESSQHLSRSVNHGHAVQTIVRRGLDRCRQCSTMDIWVSFGKEHVERRSQRLGRLAAKRRKELHLSQRELAKLAKTATNALSQLEWGKRNMSLQALLHVFGSMGMELIPVPRSLVPAVEHLLQTRAAQSAPSMSAEHAGQDIHEVV